MRKENEMQDQKPNQVNVLKVVSAIQKQWNKDYKRLIQSDKNTSAESPKKMALLNVSANHR